MRTASHVGRIRISGYHSLHRAVRSVRLPLAYRKTRLYSSKQSKAVSWRKVDLAQHAPLSLPPVSESEHDSEYWISRCDPFLPLELRSKTWEDNLSTFAGVRSVEYLPEVLARSHSAFPSGILTHIALVQKRWSAAFFLCQAILQYENKAALKPLIITNGSPWSTLKAAGPAVDVDFFKKPPNLWNVVLFQNKAESVPDRTSLDFIAGTPFIKQDGEAQLWKFAVGQIWRCIGEVMLASTEENSLLQVDMVSFVLQVVAAMHSSGVMSDDIYLFESDSVASNARKPPFLHLMSSRVMTALSDVMWKKVEPDLMRDRAFVVARHAHKGVESPAGKNGPQLRPLANEVWLELILWGCVHGEHFHVGTELLQAMFTREHRWKTVPWSELQEQLEAKLEAQQDVRKNRSWYQRLASSIEGYSEEEPFVNLAKNTISREVVMRLCDGMLSSPNLHFSTSRTTGGTLATDCFNVLDPYRETMSDTTENALLYRVIDYSVGNVLQLAQTTTKDKHMGDADRSSFRSAEQTDDIQADPRHSLLTKTLAHHIDQLDVQKALQSYEQLKTWSGAPKNDLGTESLSSATAEVPLPSRIDLPFLVPAGLFAALLDLVTNSRLFQTGQTLIEPFTQNGEMMPSTYQRSSALNQAILRFAGASSNPAILEKLRGKHYPDLRSLDTEALRELLHLEITHCNWLMARKLLQSMAELHNALALLEAGARIAVQIIRARPRTEQIDVHYLGLLTEILSGQYRPQRSKGGAVSWQEPRQLNQLAQILISIGDRRFDELEALVDRDGQLSNPIALPTPVFNMLLEAVVDVYGMSAGQKLAEQWCQTGNETGNIPGDRHFRPISPSLETMRLLIRPFTSHARRFYRHKEVFTKTGAQGKDIGPLEMLVGGRDSMRTLYESILGFYYTKHGAELQTVYFAMDVCRTRGFDQKNTFYSLLQPMEEEPDAASNSSVQPTESAAGT